MPSKDQVKALIAQGLDYLATGRRLGVPSGQAYVVGTSTPADAGDSAADPDRPSASASAQHRTNPPQENPTSTQIVHDWIARRVAADEQMRWAGAARKAQEQAQQEGKS